MRKIYDILINTNAFRDLEKPTILTSGELGIYYINTEKILRDNGEWEKYGNDSYEMISHAIKIMRKNREFKEVVNTLCEKVLEILEHKKYGKYAISGGQRRDWLFSGCVAYTLNLPHISLYKNEKAELIFLDSALILKNQNLEGFYTIHIADLVTEGSSVYRVENNEEKGWAIMLRKRKAIINNLIAVVSRSQGAEEKLKNIGIDLFPLVSINKEFLERYSSNPKRDVAYFNNPEQWSKKYLKNINLSEFLESFINFFDPNNGKLDRAKRFVARYKEVLEESGKLERLIKEVKRRYNINL